ncbi:GntR family transcriptional regulator [Enterococcus saigonensis]|uniref:GntR family transcriptional regulator n=1 Tax=Enterococcus saigonensis TaxID=1805431 RepID=A0A679I943_9ENTE|nr:GntR family transcriptional regulator [Enterococcus saigonensis]BCA84559.1 GntR family transcriptional regulator [Enterococcus saigonensis]
MQPKYLKIKNDLLQKIRLGEFEPGDQFYSESELTKMYNVSSITVIRALKELVNEGYLFSIQGKGRFVSKGKLGQTVHFTDIELFPDQETSVEVISISKSSDNRIKSILSVSDTETIYRFERLRKSNGVPFFLQYSYLSSRYISEDDVKHPERFISIYDKMREDYGLHLTTAPSVEYYKICFPTPNPMAQLLCIDDKSPTSFVERTTFLENGKPVEFIQSYKRWDYYCSKIDSL